MRATVPGGHTHGRRLLGAPVWGWASAAWAVHVVAADGRRPRSRAVVGVPASADADSPAGAVTAPEGAGRLPRGPQRDAGRRVAPTGYTPCTGSRVCRTGGCGVWSPPPTLSCDRPRVAWSRAGAVRVGTRLAFLSLASTSWSSRRGGRRTSCAEGGDTHSRGTRVGYPALLREGTSAKGVGRMTGSRGRGPTRAYTVPTGDGTSGAASPWQGRWRGGLQRTPPLPVG